MPYAAAGGVPFGLTEDAARHQGRSHLSSIIDAGGDREEGIIMASGDGSPGSNQTERQRGRSWRIAHAVTCSRVPWRWLLRALHLRWNHVLTNRNWTSSRACAARSRVSATSG